MADMIPAELRAYWLGKGLSRWAPKPHPWTTLRRLLIEERVKNGDNPAKAAAQAPGEATNLFKAHFGYGPGADVHRVSHGKPPRGKVIGPG